MEIETKSKNERLNQLVATTVVMISIMMAIFNIKDGNIVQAMQLATANSVDTWSEYQAERLKLHLAEDQVAQLGLRPDTKDKAQDVAAEVARQKQQIVKYTGKSQELFKIAKNWEAQYNALNYRDDQFDISEAMLSIAVALAAVSALTDIMWSIYVSWGFAALGALMGISGFAELPLHPDALATFLS